LAVSILKQGEYLIASIQSALTDSEVLQLQDDLAERVGRLRSRGVILDVSGLDVIDSFVTRALHSIAITTKLRGAHAVIVGIRPEVAFAIVQLGLRLEGFHTALDLEEGLALLNRRQDGTDGRVR
jgi:rsbT antagonist protein RsbS